MTETRFLCDMMLGRLAKWIRLLGYDAAYFREISDAALLRLAREENRVLLTRDTGIMERRAVRLGQVKAVLIKRDGWREQLAQLAGELGLRPSPARRCAVCNHELSTARLEDVKELVPPYVRHTQRDFRRCPACGRIYWPATHWDRIEATKTAVFKELDHAG